MNGKTKRILRAGVVTLCITGMVCAGSNVYAESSSAELEQKTNQLEDELSGLNSQLNTLCAEMDAISQEAEELASSMTETQTKLEEAQAEGEEQYEAMKLRIKYIYEAGDSSFIELLCTAENMNDFLNKTDFVKNVSEYDRQMLDELIRIQDEIMEEGDLLAQQQEELTAKQEELSETRAEVESLIASTSSDLSEYSAQLERAKEAEALKAAQEQNNSQSSQTGNSGNVAPPEYIPGSPDGKQSLGSFRISHYCPCYYCCGIWSGGNTSSGTKPTPGRTIAVDPSVIPLGTRVIINGQIYVAEDTGSSIKGKKIDIFVADHSTALSYGVYYAEVYLAD